MVVLLEGLAAVRITRDKFTGDQLRRRQELVDCIPRDIGFALPWSLGPIVEMDGLSAVATEFIRGSPCPVGEANPKSSSGFWSWGPPSILPRCVACYLIHCHFAAVRIGTGSKSKRYFQGLTSR